MGAALSRDVAAKSVPRMLAIYRKAKLIRRLTELNLSSAIVPRVRQRLTTVLQIARCKMPLFPFLPLIIWAGLLEFALNTSHDDEQDAQRDPAKIIDTPSIIPFQMTAIG